MKYPQSFCLDVAVPKAPVGCARYAICIHELTLRAAILAHLSDVNYEEPHCHSSLDLSEALKPRRTVCSPLHLLASCCRATEVLARKNQNKLHEAFVRYGQGRLRNRQFATFEPTRPKSRL